MGVIEWAFAYINGVYYMPILPMSYVNVNQSPTFELAVIYQTYVGFSYGILVVAMDTLSSSILVHIYIQLCILKESIVEMRIGIITRTKKFKANSVFVKSTQDVAGNNESIKLYIRNEFRNIIGHHADIVQFTQDFESIFQMIIFFKFIGCILSLCFLLYQMSLLPVGSIRFNYIVLLYIIFILQLLLFCWWANEAVLTGQEIGTEISKLIWIDKEPTIKKALMMIVRQSQKPLKFTAGKFFLLDLNTFVSIVYSGFSYFTILKHVDGESEIIET
ncbi:odorant receptor Or2-like [Chrysoperla carnea]|uniref:odorant receptor Or2-like n=1 Tax=Chrysoperla carnea TaxID=189513 RepID=UPI001D05DF9C|nr:odorant receptor Or2-like [Chrysoperla carnea]